jgi:ribosomal protein L16 Arg81 hydroxylase
MAEWVEESRMLMQNRFNWLPPWHGSLLVEVFAANGGNIYAHARK